MSAEYTLEFLLDFDGRRHWYADGCHVKFEIKRIKPTPERPHGLRYSFTLHDPNGKRILEFDNAHPVPAKGSRFKTGPATNDHWHRTETDPGSPYTFKDAETLIEDFLTEVGRVLNARGVPMTVVDVDDTRRRK